MRTTLETFCLAPGVSGHEGNIADVFSAMLSPFCDHIDRDPLGSVIGYLKGYADTKKTIMLEAHTDKIGLMVRHITEDGFLLVSPIGGFDTKILPATAVRIYGRRVLHGVICAVPPHIAKNDAAPKMEMLCIDTGYSRASLSDAVLVGDVVEFDTSFTALHGDMVAASAMDDRAGLAILYHCAQTLYQTSFPFNIAIVASAQEEVGLRGAYTAAYNVNPYAAVCIDVCHGQTPDASRNTFAMGGGPVITIGPNVQRQMSDRLIAVAKAQNIAYQIDVDSGDTGTDAWAVQTTRLGVYTALLSLPLRYMHSGYEVLHLKDATQTAALLCAWINEIGKQGELCF